MTRKFEQRLEEAGLLKLPERRQVSVNTTASPSSSPFGSTEDLANSHDLGYAKLVVLPSGPVCPLPNEEKMSQCNNDDVEQEEEGYANPVDALKFNPRVKQMNKAKSGHSPSPPSSPDVPPKSPLNTMSHYQSVDEVRMMREKQLREKEMEEDKLREQDRRSKKNFGGGGGAEARVSRDLSYLQCDDNSGYSRPFDALSGHRTRLPTSDLKTSPPASGSGGGEGVIRHAHRSNSAEKLAKEPSARFLHQVDLAPSSGGLFPSTGSRTRSPDRAPNSSPDMRMVGLEHPPTSQEQRSVSANSYKSGNQTGISTNLENPGTLVSRYILKVGDRQTEKGLSRGETGRTSSVDSALKSHTPAKITKLRNGKGHVAVLSSKFGESKK